jgi:hypothetical protein
MTWQQQVAGLKRQLRGKIKNPAALERLRARQRERKEPPPETIVISGKVDQKFLDRMRAMGVRVEVRS